MKRKIFFLIVFTFLFSGWQWLYGQGTPPVLSPTRAHPGDATANPVVQPVIDAQPDTLDYGEVVVLDDSIRQVMVLNLGDQNLVISDLGVVGSNDTLFTVLNPPPLPATILPGDTLFLNVRFAPLTPGNKSAFLVFTNNDPNHNPLIVMLKGVGVLPDIFITPTSLDFDSVLVSTSETLAVQISNIGVGNLIVNDLDILGANANLFAIASAPQLPIVIPPNTAPVTVEVAFTPDSVGSKQAFLSLTSNDPDNNPVFIPLSGIGIEPKIKLSSAQLTFGDVLVGEDSITTVRVWNDGNIDLVITTVALTGNNPDQFTLVNLPQPPVVLQPGVDTLALEIRFAPTTIGTKTAAIEFISNDPDDSPLDVPLAGIGVLPDIAVSPLTVTFDSVLVGDSSFSILQIFNTGSAPLTISDTSLNGANRNLFTIVEMPPLPIVIPPDSNFVVWLIRFIPDSVGNKLASLQVFSDDPDENPLNIPLIGEGVQAGISVAPNPVNFGNVRVHRDSTMTIQILNPGTATLSVTDTTLSGANRSEFRVESLSHLPFDIPAGSSSSFEIVFNPDSLGSRTALLQFTSTDPNNPLFDVALQGIGVEPDIAFASDTLNFGDVIVDSIAVASAIVMNRGSGNLRLDSLNVTGADSKFFDVVVAPNFPVSLPPGDSLSIEVKFTPPALGEKSAQLLIFSDDPDQPISVVPMIGVGVLPKLALSADTLNFGVVHLGSDSLIPLSIINEGTAPLSVTDTVITGLHASEFSVTQLPGLPVVVPVGDTLTVQVRFAPHTKGRKNALLKFTSNDPNPAPQVLLQARAVGPPTVQQMNFSDIRIGENVSITLEVTADTTIELVQVQYALANQSGFEGTVVLQPQGANQYSGTIPGSIVTPTGLKLELQIRDAYRKTVSQLLFPPVQIPAGQFSHVFPDNSLNQWRMFSLPFEPLDVARKSISAVLNDLGTEGDFTWRIFRTDSSGVNSNYFTLDQLNTLGGYGRFEPGNAFWLYLRNDADGKVPTTEITFPDMQTVPADSFQYTLQPGWNQVGSPYSFDITWNQVTSPVKDTLQVYRWNGVAWDQQLNKVGWTPLVNTNFVLSPWEGYAVRNPLSQPVTITFKPQQPDSGVLAKSAGNDPGNWQVALIGEDAAHFDVAVLGMSSRALDSLDVLDYPHPASADREPLSLYIDHPEWQGRTTAFSSDFRRRNEQGAVWYIRIAAPQRRVRLHLRELDQLPANFRVWLYDTKFRRKFEISDDRAVTLSDIYPGEENRLAVLMGTEAFLGEAIEKVVLLQPKTFELLQNFPNPFNPATTIRYQLPQDGRVELKIYNMLGQEVAVLEDGAQRAGFYELRWNGRNRLGEQVASGVYIYRLKVTAPGASFVKARKMVLLR